MAPCAHVPFGVLNEAAKKLQEFGELISSAPVVGELSAATERKTKSRADFECQTTGAWPRLSHFAILGSRRNFA